MPPAVIKRAAAAARITSSRPSTFGMRWRYQWHEARCRNPSRHSDRGEGLVPSPGSRTHAIQTSSRREAHRASRKPRRQTCEAAGPACESAGGGCAPRQARVRSSPCHESRHMDSVRPKMAHAGQRSANRPRSRSNGEGPRAVAQKCGHRAYPGGTLAPRSGQRKQPSTLNQETTAYECAEAVEGIRRRPAVNRKVPIAAYK